MLRTLTDPLLSLVYPQHCRVCAGPVEYRADGVSCGDCWEQTCFFDGHEMLCRKCGALLGPLKGPLPVSCHKCDEHHYDRAFAIGVYEKALAASILELKKTPALPQRLCSLIRAVAFSVPEADIIIPAPLSKERGVERGFKWARCQEWETSCT